MDPIRTTLGDLGLTEKEITMYMALLKHGEAYASALAEECGMRRTTAQYLCQQLEKRGLVRIVRQGNKYLFVPESPDKLIFLLEHQREELKEREEEVHRIIGSLKGMLNPQTALPKVRFFEGKEGVVEAYRQALEDFQPNGEVLTFLKPINLTDDLELEAPLLFIRDERIQLESMLNFFRDERIRKGVLFRIIGVDCPQSRSDMAEDAQYQRATRLVPADHFPFLFAEVMIYDDTICCLTIERETVFAYITESPSIAALHRGMFEELWKRLTPGAS